MSIPWKKLNETTYVWQPMPIYLLKLTVENDSEVYEYWKKGELIYKTTSYFYLLMANEYEVSDLVCCFVSTNDSSEYPPPRTMLEMIGEIIAKRGENKQRRKYDHSKQRERD
jgi:hypothetical protein